MDGSNQGKQRSINPVQNASIWVLDVFSMDIVPFFMPSWKNIIIK
jgi:hypothetical protein